MNQEFRIPRGLPIQPPKLKPKPSATRLPKQEESFAKILDQQLQGKIKFSAHAMKRLEHRGIKLDSEQISALENAMDKARDKGGRETLIVLDNVALVVSVLNRTVITAIDGNNLRDNVFTQIDSAVITSGKGLDL